MALGKAAVIGAVAAIAIPYVAGTQGDFAQLVNRGMIRLPVVDLYWSWMVFAVITLFAWGMIAWTNR